MTEFESYTSLSLTDCGDSFGVANGYINWTNAETTFNSSVPVYCNVSYKLKGDDKITCLGNGTWSQNTFCRSAGSCYLTLKAPKKQTTKITTAKLH